MRTVGVVVEYNPLHNGHLYHLQQSKKITGAEAVVAVMSGHFLQRGEPAIADKWARAEMALRAGCDLVLELPVAYSAQPAEWFAYGAVSVLEATGVVDAICFGSESGDIAALEAAAEALAGEPWAAGGVTGDVPVQTETGDELAGLLQPLLKAGKPYPAAYAEAARALLERRGLGEVAFSLSQPNHTLGLHYMIAMRRIGSRMKAFTVRREKAGYMQTDITDVAIASATALRGLLAESGSLEALAPFVPPSTLEVLRREVQAGRAPIGWEHFARPLMHELMRLEAAELATYAEVNEGLEHRLKRVLFETRPTSFEALLDGLKTKRYTRTKLQRMLTRILLGHRKTSLSREKLAEGVPYVRVLGFTSTGQALLRRMRKSASVPVVLSASGDDSPYLAMDARASAVYALAFGYSGGDDGWRDFTRPPVRVE